MPSIIIFPCDMYYNLCMIYSTLNSQWEEKVKVIDSLEESLQQLQASFSEREKQLVLEKEAALQSARYSTS